MDVFLPVVSDGIGQQRVAVTWKCRDRIPIERKEEDGELMNEEWTDDLTSSLSHYQYAYIYPVCQSEGAMTMNSHIMNDRSIGFFPLSNSRVSEKNEKGKECILITVRPSFSLILFLFFSSFPVQLFVYCERFLFLFSSYFHSIIHPILFRHLK